MGRGMVAFLGITGPSCGGKSYLAKELQAHLQERGISFKTFHQDDYYDRSAGEKPRNGQYQDWDCPRAFDYGRLWADLAPFLADDAPARVLLLEGILILSDPRILGRLDWAVVLDLPYSVCKQRRDARVLPETIDGRAAWADPEGYYERVVYPNYQQYCLATAVGLGGRALISKTYEAALEGCIQRISALAPQ